MNKLQTIVGSSFFVVEAIIISIFLLDISINTIEAAVPWILGGALNIAFLFVLFNGAFAKE